MDGKISTSLGWLLGCSLILIGFWLSTSYFLSGLFIALVGFLWWPPSRHFILERLQLPPVRLLHIGLTLCFLVIALFAFIGRHTLVLEERAREAGYPSIEAWQEAKRTEAAD